MVAVCFQSTADLGFVFLHLQATTVSLFFPAYCRIEVADPHYSVVVTVRRDSLHLAGDWAFREVRAESPLRSVRLFRQWPRFPRRFVLAAKRAQSVAVHVLEILANAADRHPVPRREFDHSHLCAAQEGSSPEIAFPDVPKRRRRPIAGYCERILRAQVTDQRRVQNR